jgi:Xaa-Pro aminopeptidase
MTNYILKDENAVYYECGFSCDNEIFLKIGDEAYFITDPRYTIEAQHQVRRATVIEAKLDLIKEAKKLILKHRVKKVFFNPKEWTVADFNKLSTSRAIRFKASLNFSQKKRIIKTDKEIELIKKAVSLGANAFDCFASYLQQNGFDKSEKYLFHEAMNCFMKHGEYDLSFDPIVALEASSAKPHAFASETKIKQDDLILVDAGLKYKRYCSDRTRVAQVSNNMNFTKEQKFSSPKKQKIYDTVLKAQEAALKFAKAGVRAADIDKAARDVIESAGYGDYFVHSTGHGVGLDIHELPVISKRSEAIIEENMIFTIEPGIYIPNEFGVRIEDMVRVTGEGIEIL